MQLKKREYSGAKSCLVKIEKDQIVLDVYFSYETIIAFRYNTKLFISINEWSTTSGRHLNSINTDKTIRIPHKEVMDQFNSLEI
ncbi:MAG: hypothetical protein ACTSP9_03155 [Promethearchaeota archaeon]